MKRLSNLATIAAVRSSVLSVSPMEEDHSALDSIFNDAAGAAPVAPVLRLSRTRTLSSALTALRRAEFAVVMCERDLPSGNWKDLLESTRCLVNPPLLIVTSRLADDYLWAEALNLGAYDVLAKPFDPSEVIRTVSLACQRWQRERQHASHGTEREHAAIAV